MGRNPDSPRRIAIGSEEARQGRIVLTTKSRRAIFIGGLIGIGILLAVLAIVRRAMG
jgi:hypothetical protein